MHRFLSIENISSGILFKIERGINKMKLIKKHWLVLLGVVIGALVGYLYWRFAGCSSGTCVITSSPLNSSLWGAVIGGLLFGMFKKKKQNE